MLVDYLPVFIMIVLGGIVGLAFLYGSEFLGARRSTEVKKSTYESGMVPRGTARNRFTIKFYMVAVSFLIFDIEVVFMYPWAVQLKEIGFTAFWAMLVFIVILFAGYFYELKKGGFEWD
ncbi:MAG: NADH-quinone oxidoreductase subunit A [Candidatus Kapabacteria bacterium]|nr:NADH-quinone oxidoreductase subunit A [Candidatus Kapabacteria bacterium]